MPEIIKNPRRHDSPVKQDKETTAGKSVQKNDRTQTAPGETDASRVSKTSLSKIKRSKQREGVDGVSIIRAMRDATRRI